MKYFYYAKVRTILTLEDKFYNRNKLEKTQRDEKYFTDICLTYKITNKEKEILQFLLLGLFEKEISEKFDISIKTVESHIYNIYKKLKVNNKIELYNIFN